MTSTPDSISFTELQRFADEAQERTNEQQKEPLEPTRENILEAAVKAIDSATDQVPDPMVHKIMILEILSNMVEWHTSVGTKLMNEDETEAGVAWLRDAGKLQSMIGTILNIQLGQNDWTCE